MGLYKNLLLMRFVLLNAGLGALAFMLWRGGVLEGNPSNYISYSIGAMYLIGMALVTRALYLCSVCLDQEITSPIRIPNIKEALRNRLDSRVNPIEFLAYTSVTLGMAGTVYGFWLAIGQVDVESAGDVDAIVPMITMLLQGMGIAIWTTLHGLAAYLAISFNIRLLEGGHDRLYRKMITGIDGR